jgi:DNA replication and repair protein RecF
MLEWGSIVLRQRLYMLRQVDQRMVSIFRDLAGTTETLRVVYRSGACEMQPDDGDGLADMDALSAGFRQRQERVAAREIDQAVSLIGPHRDDFVFLLDGIDLNTYGSRGQQRLAVLALKLAEADWMRAEIDELPVVLLDDVLSELDPQRREYVLQRVAEPEPTQQRQVWITTTETTSLARTASQTHDFLSRAQCYEIDAGRVRTA